MGRVEGKVAFVTGIGLGQGRAHAVRLAEEGAMVVGIDATEDYACIPYPMATEDDVDETVRMVEEAGGRIMFRKADVRVRSQLEAVVAEAYADLGGIDIVVANAGICPASNSFWDIPADRWDTVFDVDCKGVWNTVSAAAPRMIDSGRSGSIVMTSSLLGMRAGANLADYSSAKHAVIGLMRSCSAELAPHMIRVNAVCPNSVNTNMINNDAIFRLFRPDLENPTREDTVQGFMAIQALPIPWLEPEDIANAVLWFASEESRYVTGVYMPVGAAI